MGVSVPPPGRRFVLGFYGSLILLVSGIVLYSINGPGYQLFFILFAVYLAWLCLRFLLDRNKPVEFVPWYYSRPKAALAVAMLNFALGLLNFMRNTNHMFYLYFSLSAVSIIGAYVVHYRETQNKNLPTDRE